METAPSEPDSKTKRSTWAWVRTVRLGRPLMGRKNAFDAFHWQPPFLLTPKLQTPALSLPFKSSICAKLAWGRCVGEGFQYLPPQALLFHAPFAPAAGQTGESRAAIDHRIGPVIETVVVLVGFEVAQRVFPAPCWLAGELGPRVIVLALAAHVDHPVDGGTTAERLAWWVAQRAPLQPSIRLALVESMDTRTTDAVQITHWNVDPGVVVFLAGVEQQQPPRQVLAQSACQ